MEKLTDKIRRGGFPLCIEKARLITESYKANGGRASHHTECQSLLKHAGKYASID